VKPVPLPVLYATVVMLIIAVAPLSYGYYTLLRLVATVMFCWAAVVSCKRKASFLPCAFGLFALLFNPIIPVSFEKEIWAVLDITAAGFLLATMRHVARRRFA
jgi:hypothetical protein